MMRVYFASSLLWDAAEEEMIETADPEKLKRLETRNNIYTGRNQVFNKGEDVFLGKKVR